jgi:hypothetical protein
VTGLDKKSNICVHKRYSHRDIFTVGKNSNTVCPALLDEAEDIIPPDVVVFQHINVLMDNFGKNLPSTIQSRRVSSQFEQDLLHVEGCRQGLDENGSTNRSVWNSDVGLGKVEDIIPKTGFEVMFHFWEIEVRTVATLDEFLRVVIKIDCKIKQRTRNGSIVNSHTRFIKMPSSGSAMERRKKIRLHDNEKPPYRTISTAGLSVSL